MEMPLWLLLAIMFFGVFMLGAFTEHVYHIRKKDFKEDRGLYPGEKEKNDCDVRRSEDYDLQCQRCYDLTDILYKHYGAMDGSTDDWEGQPIPEGLREDIWLCWDCDWEVTNGYDMEVDIGELMMDREERAYEEDPINNTPPWLNYVQ